VDTCAYNREIAGPDRAHDILDQTLPQLFQTQIAQH
jgi:hypothetical protein